MPQQTDLQSWLNAHLFRRTDLHAIFSKLSKSGADLDYVLFVCGVFTFGEFMRRRLKFDKRRGLFPVSLSAISISRPTKLKASMRFGDALGEASRPLDIPRLKECLNHLEMVYDTMNECVDTISAACDASPLFSLIVQFSFPRDFFLVKGDAGDRWGSFFLLTVTDHLKSRGRKPNHKLAYRLLTMLRKDSRLIENPRQSVAGRVATLKTTHPHWRAALTLLESEFSKVHSRAVES